MGSMKVSRPRLNGFWGNGMNKVQTAVVAIRDNEEILSEALAAQESAQARINFAFDELRAASAEARDAPWPLPAPEAPPWGGTLSQSPDTIRRNGWNAATEWWISQLIR